MARCGTSRHRRGLASLELVLFLPFLVVLTAMIFTIGGAAVTRGNVAVQARNDAWQTTVDRPDRQLEWWGTTPASGTIISANPDASRGTVHKTSTAPIKAFAGRALGVGQTAAAEHAVIHGSWDSTAIRIEADSMPVLPSRQLRDFVGAIPDFLTNLNNLKFLLKNIKVGNGDLTVGDLMDAADDLKDLKDNLADFGDAAEFPPNFPKIGRTFPRIVKNAIDLAGTAGKLSKQMGAPSPEVPKDPGTPSAVEVIKLIKEVPDALEALGKSITRIGPIIDRLTSSNDY